MVKKKVTLADHAELWWKGKGHKVPKKGSKSYKSMYEKWVGYAFKDFK